MLNALRGAKVDKEAVMVNSTAIRVHAYGANPGDGQAAQAMARCRFSLSSKIHPAVTFGAMVSLSPASLSGSNPKLYL